jgi:hypothetical protein
MVKRKDTGGDVDSYKSSGRLFDAVSKFGNSIHRRVSSSSSFVLPLILLFTVFYVVASGATCVMMIEPSSDRNARESNASISMETRKDIEEAEKTGYTLFGAITLLYGAAVVAVVIADIRRSG